MSVDASQDELENDLATGKGPFYAIKIVDRNGKKRLPPFGRRGREGAKLVAENEMRKEIAILKKLHHPNVVALKEIIDDPDSKQVYMILEYCQGGEVRWKQDNRPTLTIAETRKIFRDTLLGLEYRTCTSDAAFVTARADTIAVHHQGVIHRDIKPSNLLCSGDVVKISDFGCSHFSEALYAADGGGYVDDIELAKTAGSPAFFAPEMCYSEIPDEPTPTTPGATTDSKVPTFTVRPPSTTQEDTSSTTKASSTYDPRLSVTRSMSTATIPNRQRRPITNAIDVWALGVTLYCLLFGKTPFDAQNEYLLMQVIPTAEYETPATMGKEQVPTSGPESTDEVREALDLLSKLLEKDAGHRITLDQAKRHPFALRGMKDPQGWLNRTSIHDQTCVTVTNEEVAAAVTRGNGIRDKLKRGLSKLSNRLGFHRNRSRSVTGSDHADQSAASSASETPSNTRRVASGDSIPSTASGPSIGRRLSILHRNPSNRVATSASAPGSGDESSRPVGLIASQLGASQSADRSPPSTTQPVHSEEFLRQPSSTSVDNTPRQMRSIQSLEKLQSATTAPNYGRRRSLVEPEMMLRSRSASNASSSAGSILGAIMGRTAQITKQRSLRGTGLSTMRSKSQHDYSSQDDHDTVFGSSIDSHATEGRSELLRGRSFDESARRQSLDTFESGSPSSRGSHGFHSPERLSGWDQRFLQDQGMPLRRGSNLSDRPVMEIDDEDLDWDVDVPDSDDEDSSSSDGLPKGHGLSSAPADWNLSHCLGDLDKQAARRAAPTSPTRASAGGAHSPVRTGTAQSLLRPGGGLDMNRLGRPPSSFSYRPRPSPLVNDAAAGVSSSESSPGGNRSTPNASSAPSLAASTNTVPSGGMEILNGQNSPTSQNGHPTHLSALTGSAVAADSNTADDRFADADEDCGLVLGMRRRKSSALSRGNSVRSRAGQIHAAQAAHQAASTNVASAASRLTATVNSDSTTSLGSLNTHSLPGSVPSLSPGSSPTQASALAAQQEHPALEADSILSDVPSLHSPQDLTPVTPKANSPRDERGPVLNTTKGYLPRPRIASGDSIAE